MLTLKKIAVTGSIASGKSSLCRILENHGAFQVSSDEIIHQLLQSHLSCIQLVIHLLGKEILTDGKIDRKKVAKIVFVDPNKLEALEKILHPLLLEEIARQYEEIKSRGTYKLFVVELPLVQEIGKTDLFDAIICVKTNQDLAKERFCKAGFTSEEYERRMKRHYSEKEKLKGADYVIENNGTLEELEKQALDSIVKLNKLKNSS